MVEPEEPSVQGGSFEQQGADTQPKPPSPAAARRRIMAQEARVQEEARAEQARRTRRRVMIGGGVALGLVATVAIVYWSKPGGNTAAHCVDDQNQPVAASYCDNGTGLGGFFYFGGRQYHYYYGGSVSPSGRYTGGSIVKPKSGSITTDSGKTIRRGGFGGRISHGIS